MPSVSPKNPTEGVDAPQGRLLERPAQRRRMAIGQRASQRCVIPQESVETCVQIQGTSLPPFRLGRIFQVYFPETADRDVHPEPQQQADFGLFGPLILWLQPERHCK